MTTRKRLRDVREEGGMSETEADILEPQTKMVKMHECISQ